MHGLLVFRRRHHQLSRILYQSCQSTLWSQARRLLLQAMENRQEECQAPQICHFLQEKSFAAYKECNGITTEEDFHVGNSTVDRKNLCKAYQDIDDDVCLMGLEVFILLAIRGESFHQVRYILGMVEQRMGGKEAMNANPLQRDQMMRLFSQYISLPSRVYVRELALAQAAVVKNEWNVK
mmetsp:Transcript_10461/g.21506  ORF Transcript_10461/g.21506 Transcript_10461/m.21506 type:complete len:180 (+) Transcript_10461:358-897(+)